MLQFAQRKSALGTKQSCELCVLFMVGPLPMTRAVTATLAVADLNCAHGFKRSPFQPACLPRWVRLAKSLFSAGGRREKTTPVPMRPQPFRRHLPDLRKHGCRRKRGSGPASRVAPRSVQLAAEPAPHPLKRQPPHVPTVPPGAVRALRLPFIARDLSQGKPAEYVRKQPSVGILPEVFWASNHAGRRLAAKIFSSVWMVICL